MGIAITVREYLEDLDVIYDIVEHPLSMTSIGAAYQAHLPPNALAKGVVLKDENDTLSLVVIPSDRRIDLKRINETLGHSAHLASEVEVVRKFDDCEQGAVPPIGNAYAMRVLLDDRLTKEDEVYLEAGDHHGLVHVKGEEFRRLMGGALNGTFSHAN